MVVAEKPKRLIHYIRVMVQRKKNMEKITGAKVQLFITLGAVALALFNIYLATKLYPLAESDLKQQASLAVMAQEVADLQKDNADDVSTAEFNQVVTRLDRISSRLDQVYSIVANRK